MMMGLGLYPQQQCYDPNRSSLLPYWVNDSIETACMEANGWDPSLISSACLPSLAASPAAFIACEAAYMVNNAGAIVAPATVVPAVSPLPATSPTPSVPSQALTTPATPCGNDPTTGQPYTADECATMQSNAQIAAEQTAAAAGVNAVAPSTCSFWDEVTCDTTDCTASQLPFYCNWGLSLTDVGLIGGALVFGYLFLTRR